MRGPEAEGDHAGDDRPLQPGADDPSGAPPTLPARPGLRLRLVVAGGSLRSRRAVMNLRVLCAHHLPECEVEVADLHHAPAMADAHGVVAVPTLLRLAPLPVRRVVGDLADTQAVLRGLGLVPPPPDAPPDAAPPVAGR